jgi:hypothetical protein
MVKTPINAIPAVVCHSVTMMTHAAPPKQMMKQELRKQPNKLKSKLNQSSPAITNPSTQESAQDMEAATKMGIVTASTSVDSMIDVVTRPSTHANTLLIMPETALTIIIVIQIRVMEIMVPATAHPTVFGIQIVAKFYLSAGKQAQLNP